MIIPHTGALPNPLAICFSMVWNRSAARRPVIEFVDICPTLAAFAGIAAPKDFDGESLVPLVENPLAEWDGLAVAQVQGPADDRLSEPVLGCSMRTARYRYTEWGEDVHDVELNDHHADLQEFNNVAMQPDSTLMGRWPCRGIQVATDVNGASSRRLADNVCFTLVSFRLLSICR